MNYQLQRTITIVALVLILVGIFSPIFKADYIGGLTIITNSTSLFDLVINREHLFYFKMLSLYLFVLVILVLICTNIVITNNHYKLITVWGVVCLIATSFTLYEFRDFMDNELNDGLSPFNLSAPMFSLSFGWSFFFIGSFLLIVSGLLGRSDVKDNTDQSVL